MVYAVSFSRTISSIFQPIHLWPEKIAARKKKYFAADKFSNKANIFGSRALPFPDISRNLTIVNGFIDSQLLIQLEFPEYPRQSHCRFYGILEIQIFSKQFR